MPVEIKVATPGEANSEVEIRVDELDQDTRICVMATFRHLEDSQLVLSKGQPLQLPGVERDFPFYLDRLISSCELQGGHLLAIMEDSHSDGSQPSVVPVGLIRDKESVHLQLSVADEVEGGVVSSLEGVAEQLSSG